jgi:acyl-CoA thioester hydrolase
VFARFFEHARYIAHSMVGLPPLMRDSGDRILVARLAIDYIAEAHFGTPLHIRTRVASFGRSSLVEQQAAWQGDRCVAIAEVVIAYRHGSESMELPSSVRAIFEGIAVAGIT